MQLHLIPPSHWNDSLVDDDSSADVSRFLGFVCALIMTFVASLQSSLRYKRESGIAHACHLAFVE